MISEFNVTLIVSTCNLTEKGRTKCHKFWPGEDAETAALEKELDFVGITVKPVGGDIKLTPNLILRKFDLSDAVIGFTNRQVVQLHYTGWPDHGVPSGDSIDSFSQMLDIFMLMILAS